MSPVSVFEKYDIGALYFVSLSVSLGGEIINLRKSRFEDAEMKTFGGVRNYEDQIEANTHQRLASSKVCEMAYNVSIATEATVNNPHKIYMPAQKPTF